MPGFIDIITTYRVLRHGGDSLTDSLHTKRLRGSGRVSPPGTLEAGAAKQPSPAMSSQLTARRVAAPTARWMRVDTDRQIWQSQRGTPTPPEVLPRVVQTGDVMGQKSGDDHDQTS